MSGRAGWLRRKSKSISIVLASVVSIGLVHHVFIGDTSDPETHIGADVVVQSPFATLPIVDQLDEVITATRPVLSTDIEFLSGSGEFQRAKNALLDRALDAVGAADNSGLAFHLSELGELALLQGDLGMAEVYFSEALELYEELQDEIQAAGIHIQMGRLHLYARQRARKASDAYDQLLVSRWKISQGRFSEAEGQLKQIVDSNIELNRFGAAASALETLHRGYSIDHNIADAERVGIEAIKLHASSGNSHAANQLFTVLKDNGLSRVDMERVDRELQQHLREYEASVKAIGAARDYAQLYNQLLSRGDALQALLTNVSVFYRLDGTTLDYTK